MSERQEKRKHRFARQIYEARLHFWLDVKPPKWRIFKYRKWRKSKPTPPKHINKESKK